MVEKLACKRPIGRAGSKWEDNIKIELEETGWSGLDWIGLASDRHQWWALVDAVANIQPL